MTTETTPSPQRVLLIGGTSDIGLAILRSLARQRPVRPYLLGRRAGALDTALDSLTDAGCVDGARAVFDADDLDSHERVIEEAFRDGGPFDLVILAVGLLGAQDALEAPRDDALAVMRVNFLDCGSLLLASMRALHASGGGTLVVLSSVAAERPRAGNAIYGAAKAGIDALSQGLADAAPADVRVLVVRPGFVHTKMTAGLPSAPFATTPEAVAAVTVRGLEGRAHTVWAPSALRFVFSLLRHLPRPIYRRLPL